MAPARVKWVVATGALVVPSVAFGQTLEGVPTLALDPDLDRSDVAGAREDGAYRPKPLRLGRLRLTPAVSLAAGYDSNVFNRPDRHADALAILRPHIDIDTDLSRHALVLSATGAVRRYAREQGENSEEYSLTGRGRIDVADRHALTGDLEFGQRVEPRSSAGSVPDAAEPVSYRRFAADIGANLAFGAIRLVPGLRAERVTYLPVERLGGGTLAQDYRDTRRTEAELRVEYEFTGFAAVFASGRHATINTPERPNGTPGRDARDLSLVAGVKGEVAPLVSVEVALGYQARDYRSGPYRDFSGVAFRVDAQWYATPLVTLRLQADRRFRNSGDPRVAGILEDRLALSGYYDPLRNLRLSATAAQVHSEFRDTQGRASRRSFELRGQYRVSPHLALGATMGLTRQTVRGPAPISAFTSFSTAFGLTFTP